MYTKESFQTYRKNHVFKKAQQDILSIDETIGSLQNALYSCAGYIQDNGHTPNLLIERRSGDISQKLAYLQENNMYTKIHEFLVCISDFIEDHTYQSLSSSLSYFLIKLHDLCDVFEEKNIRTA